MSSNKPVQFNTIADRNTVFSTLENKWSVVDHVYGGTDTMRAAGEELLPRGEHEERTVYQERLAESTLEPLYRHAVDLTVDMIVSNDIQVNTRNNQLQDFFQDVDGSGTDITQFSEQVLRLSVHYGISYIVVDYPSENDTANSQPFLSSINPRNVLGFNTQRVNGQEILTDIRYFETVSREEDSITGHNDTMSDLNQVQGGLFADQIRQYSLDLSTNTVTYTMYTRTKDKRTWAVSKDGVIDGLTRIPVVPVYGNKDSYFIGTPLYYDAAMLNIKLWRTQSIQDYALKFNRYPAYIVTGVGSASSTSPANPNDMPETNAEQSQVKIPYGPGTIHGTPNTDVDILKFDGQSEPLTLGFTDIDRTKSSIKEIAPILLVAGQAIGNETATATLINQAQSTKTVKRLAHNYTNTLIQLSGFVGAYYTLTDLPTFDISTQLIEGNDSNNDDK